MRRHPNRSRRSSRHRRPSPGKIATLVLLPVVAIGAGVGALMLSDEGVAMTDDFCFPSADQFHAAYFVDSSFTHQTSEQQNLDLERSLKRAYSRLPANGQLSVFTTTSDVHASVVEPKFSICKPPSTQEELRHVAPDASKTPQQLTYASQQAHDAFSDRLAIAIREGQDEALTASYSPILETIRGISRYYDAGELDRFEMYSDGIVNSPVSQWCAVKGDFPPFHVFAKRPDYAELQPRSLFGVDVHIWLIEWPSLPGAHCTRRELRAFWPAFFEGQDAADVQIDYLAYGG